MIQFFSFVLTQSSQRAQSKETTQWPSSACQSGNEPNNHQIKPNQTKPNQTKPNQTKSNQTKRYVDPEMSCS